ncbi:MAG: SPFH domain-containing protein [Clostridia bacterium]|nr:SPFH domain-containing protein [Clostridia bacterium]
MAKFALECPKCGSVNTASTLNPFKKAITCGSCGEEINIKASRITSKECPHCHKIFVYDQAKTKNRKCPSCGKDINAAQLATVKYKMESLNCPQCACSIEVDSTKENYFCPICDHQINVQQELAKAKLVNAGGVSVIKYEGDNSTFVWKHPIENFNFGSQLIVHESQEAIFFLNGEALDAFGPGRHTLETENIPILKKVYSLPTAPQEPFHAEVYFINKTVQMGIKWGTDTRVRFVDPVTGIPLDIGAYGEMNMQVVDSRKLLVKLVGTTSGLTNKDVLASTGDNSAEVHKTLRSYFRAPLMSEIKSYLATVIKEKNINIFEIDSHMGSLSEDLCKRISPKFEEFGLSIPSFYITGISLPEDDKNFREIKEMISKAYIGVKAEEIKTNIAEAAKQRQIVEEQTKAELEAIRAQGQAASIRAKGLAEAEVMRAKGYTEKDILDADVQKAFAAGMGQMGSSGGGGGSNIGADFIGMMAGMKMAGNVLDRMDSAMNTAQNTVVEPVAKPDTWTCSCGESGNTKKFCMNCGKPRDDGWDCPVCGNKGNKGKFCEECGAPKVEEWTCSACGAVGNKGKFCAECGAKKE